MDITPRTTRPTDMTIAYASREDMKFNPGRRAEIKYRDLLLEEATGGDMRAEIMHIDHGAPARPTGWHYHTADIQFLFVVKGWVKMEFPDRGVITLGEGESIMIPGGTVHQELQASEPMELLEISIPAKLRTVNVDRPDWGQEDAENYGEISAPQAVGHSA